MQIRVGVIGCGYGKSVIAPAFRADAHCQIVAIAADHPASAQETAAQLEIAHLRELARAYRKSRS